MRRPVLARHLIERAHIRKNLAGHSMLTGPFDHEQAKPVLINMFKNRQADYRDFTNGTMSTACLIDPILDQELLRPLAYMTLLTCSRSLTMPKMSGWR